MGKKYLVKLKLAHFRVSSTCRVSIKPGAPAAAATGRVGMSTRPDPYY